MSFGFPVQPLCLSDIDSNAELCFTQLSLYCDKLMRPEAPVRSEPLSWVFTSASGLKVRLSLNLMHNAGEKEGCLVKCLVLP